LRWSGRVQGDAAGLAELELETPWRDGGRARSPTRRATQSELHGGAKSEFVPWLPDTVM
jgi:hypothetical protein